MKCPQCHTDNPEGAKFCNECGRAFDRSAFRNVLPNPLDVQDSSIIRECATAKLCQQSEESSPIPDVSESSQKMPDATASQTAVLTRAESISVASAATVAAKALQTANSSNEDAYAFVDTSGIDATMQMPYVFSEPIEYAAPQLEPLEDPTGDGEGPLEKKRRSRRISIIVLASVVLLAAIIAGVTYSMELWGGVKVPDVCGLTEEQARTILQERGFSVRAMQVKSDDTEGKVVLSDPKGGERARKGGEVVIHVAVARTIPDIVGKTEEEAKKLLEESGYTNITFEKKKSDNEDKTVLEVSPEAGTKVNGSAAVKVIVAEAYTVPDVVGLSEAEAVAKVQEAGYNAQVAYVYSETIAQGQVMSTSPEADTKLASQSTVIIKVSKSRSSELTELTMQILSPGNEVQIGSTNYLVHSLESVSYAGNDVVDFTIVGQAFTILDGEKVYGSIKTISAAAHFDSANNYSLY